MTVATLVKWLNSYAAYNDMPVGIVNPTLDTAEVDKGYVVTITNKLENTKREILYLATKHESKSDVLEIWEDVDASVYKVTVRKAF